MVIWHCSKCRVLCLPDLQLTLLLEVRDGTHVFVDLLTNPLAELVFTDWHKQRLVNSLRLKITALN